MSESPWLKHIMNWTWNIPFLVIAEILLINEKNTISLSTVDFRLQRNAIAECASSVLRVFGKTTAANVTSAWTSLSLVAVTRKGRNVDCVSASFSQSFMVIEQMYVFM